MTKSLSGYDSILDELSSHSSSLAEIAKWNVKFPSNNLTGAKGNATYKNNADGLYYQDSAYTIRATDDSAVLQAIFNSITAGDKVEFPPGRYLVNSEILINSWCEIEGNGLPFAINGVQIVTENPNITLFHVNTETIKIHNIGFLGVSRDSGTSGIALKLERQSGTSIINDIRIDNCWFNGFSHSAIYMLQSQGCHFIDCTFEFCNRAFFCGDSTVILTFNQNMISECRFYACFYCIYLYAPALPSGSNDNASMVKWNIITNNIIDFNGNYQVNTTDNIQSAIFLGDNANHNIIANNSFANNQYFDIYMVNNKGNILEGNSHERTGKAPIYAQNCSYTNILASHMISSNYYKATFNQSHSAIELINCTNFEVTDNIVYSYSGENRIDYGINVDLNCTLIETKGNNISGTLLGRISNANGMPDYAGRVTQPWMDAGIKFGINGQLLLAGPNSPLGVVSAPPGSIYLRSSGGVSTTLYVKESGTDSSGWVAK